jgi:hypothetical protein
LSIHEINTLPEIAKNFIYKYAFLSKKGESKGLYILSGDNDKYQNSSNELKNIEELTNSNPYTDNIITTRNINKNEELISSYEEWDDAFAHKL